MKGRYLSNIYLVWVIFACQSQTDFQEEQNTVTSQLSSAPVKTGEIDFKTEDTLSVITPGVVFFTPPPQDLEGLDLDESALQGLQMAVGDFAYYASLVEDSLKNHDIPVTFTDRPFISFLPHEDMVVARDQHPSRMMGVALYDGKQPPEIIYGLQTHLALWAAIKDYFQTKEESSKPLLQYFEPTTQRELHIYASHSEILNQTGERLGTGYHSLFGTQMAKKASKYRFGLFAYYRFPITEGLTALVCRVPSRYDESAINLYVWNEQTQTIIEQIPLAENLWDDHSIMVMDSWIKRDPNNNSLEIIQRKKEASIDGGHRTETDSLYRWKWSDSGFKRSIAGDLKIKQFPLKDWASHESSKPVIKELTIVDNEFVWLPLETGDLSWENLMMTIPKQYQLVKEPIPNQFNQQQVDTLVTLSQPNLKLQFYRTPEENLILSGSIQDQSIIFKNGLQIGITKNRLKELYPQLSNRNTLPDQVVIKSRHGDRVFSCHFLQDTLTNIEITNYIH